MKKKKKRRKFKKPLPHTEHAGDKILDPTIIYCTFSEIFLKLIANMFIGQYLYSCTSI